MRIPLVFFLLIFAINADAQLRGNYCRRTGFESTCIKFLADSCFEYSYHHCTGRSLGIGHYTVSNDSVMLAFERLPKQLLKPFLNIEYTPTNGDSIDFSIIILDERKQPLIGAGFEIVYENRIINGDFVFDENVISKRLFKKMTLQ